ncbi:MAG: C69 family dipeptidase [candidate division Zixibacteria bacterium]
MRTRFLNTMCIIFFCLCLALSSPARSVDFGCYSIVVGKDASSDGYVIMAHNEDDGPPCVVNHHKVPKKEHSPDEKFTLLKGGQIDEVEETYSYIWSEMPGFLFSDSYSNEYGVSITSNACPSREDKPELTDGGISYNLRKLVVQRCKTSRDGVLLAGNLVEQFGYDASGRTLIISDPDEGWLFAAVNGKRWVAQRVPDNHVAVIANTYSIHEIDLSDKANFLSSPDIIEYAVSREWYDPEKDGPFDFAAVYADPEAAAHPTNIGRHWAGLRLLAADQYGFEDNLPFSFEPKSKVDVAAIMTVLRDHYEGTDIYEPETQDDCSHDRSFRPICRSDTRTSFIVQLRKNLPLDIGINYWMSLASPCVSTYIPFYFGMDSFPEGYAGFEDPDMENYNHKINMPFAADIDEAFWTFSNCLQKIDGESHDLLSKLRTRTMSIENNALEEQAEFEKEVLALHAGDVGRARKMLALHSNDIYRTTMKAMEEVFGAR